jgi:hypothetical protein
MHTRACAAGAHRYAVGIMDDSMPTASEQEDLPASGSRRLLLGIAAAVIVAAGVGAYFWFDSGAGDNPQEAARREVTELVALVSELMVLPEGEDPVVATVADLGPLKDQPFFAKARVGDKVLIFNNARKAILYNPEEHRIVEVAPLNPDAP